MSLRLTPEVDQIFRDRIRRRGDLTRLLNAILDVADLDTIKLLEIRQTGGQQTVEQTSFQISEERHARVAEAALRRECSINVLINSAIFAECGSHNNCLDIVELELRAQAKMDGRAKQSGFNYARQRL